MQPNPLILQYRRTLSQYYKFKHRLERRLKNHSLQELSIRNRNRLIRTIERLKRRLASLQLQLKLGIASAGLFLALGAVQDGLAQAPTPVGSEFQVNTHTTTNQLEPSVAVDSDGDFVITWQSNIQDGSGSGIYAQRYNASGVAQGSEFQANTYTTFAQTQPTIAIDNDGDFVIAWSSYGQDGSGYGVYAQRYNAAGVTQGSEFQANTYTTGSQGRPTIAMDNDGDFVIAWESNGQYGSDYGIYAQRYNAAGAAQDSEFKVNTYTTNRQWLSSIAMDDDGDFVIAWHSNYQDGSYSGVYAQRYNAAGVAQGSEFQVNTYTTSYQRNASIAMDSDGDFVIAWESFTQDGFGYGVYAQRYNASGVAQGSEFQVNTYTTGFQSDPSTAMDNNGDFVIAWHSPQDGSGYGIYAQRYSVIQPCDPPTNPISSNIMDNTADLDWDAEPNALSYDVKYRALGAGSWTTENTATNSLSISGLSAGLTHEWKVRAICAADGSNSSTFSSVVNFTTLASPSPLGIEFQVNTYTTGNQGSPSIGMDNNGDFVITWESGFLL